MDNTFESVMVPTLVERVPTNTSTKNAFIEANTREMTVKELRDTHIIPVFPVTNEPLISHHQLLETISNATFRNFPMERINEPAIRVSHPIKGRIPDAKHKKAAELEPWEETLYYERMMFLIEIPSIQATVGGNTLSLSIGAVKAYNLDNVYSKRSNPGQQFKLFIGFQNRVCCNLCVSTDGFKMELNIHNIHQLNYAVNNLIASFQMDRQIDILGNMDRHHLTESQFAQVVGRTRMYKHLPEGNRIGIPPILLGDQQLGMVAKSYYSDDNFSRNNDGSLSLWKLYNLMTGANKSTYIDQFLDRAVNATDFVGELTRGLTDSKTSWYLG